MQARVTAILVARNGDDYLGRTLPSLAAQTRRPDSLVFVDDASTDGTSRKLADAGPTTFVQVKQPLGFGAAVAEAHRVAGTSDEEQDSWLWLLGHDNAPAPGALAALLHAVEIAPSVAVAGPKLMRWDEHETIESYGETLTRSGASVSLVSGELDQAQHDRHSDLLAVAAGGMLVRESVYAQLGGFDPALPTIDAALDFCIRVRLAGHRIVGVPDARVSSAGPPESFGREPLPPRVVNAVARRAQLHRRLVYAPVLAVPLHWLLLVPLAFVRSIGHLVGKHPGSIAGEFASAFGSAFDAGVYPARRRLRRGRRLGWGAIAPLRLSPGDARELRANQRASTPSAVARLAVVATRASFLSQGGAWIVLLAAAVGAVSFAPLFGAATVAGGGLAPLSASVGELWANVGYGWREVGAGFTGAADPFAFILAILGSLTFWAPSLSIVLLYFAALPLAALGAWWCAARFSERGWAPAVAAILWAVAPPFLAALDGGHLGAVIAHLLLPWLVLATVNAPRNWAAGAGSALLLAATVASAPSLAPALLVGWLAWLFANPRRIHRLIGIVIPALALFAPLVVQQVMRETPLGLAADPGVPTAAGTASGWKLVLGSPVDGYSGWSAVVTRLGEFGAPLVVAALLLPLAVLALLALFLPGSRRAIPALALALLGFATAVAAAHVQVASVGETAVGVWPGSGLSLFWLGLVGAAVLGLEAIGSAVVLPALLVAVASIAVAAPLLAAPVLGNATIAASAGRMLPAYVTAEAADDPQLGTLELVAQPDGALAAILHRGTGTTLDSRSTLATTAVGTTEAQRRIATLAGNLASESGFDSEAELQALHIGYVVAPTPSREAGEAAAEVRERTGEALDGNQLFTAIGSTDSGFLWRFAALDQTDPPTGSGPLSSPLGLIVLLSQLLVLFVTVLLAVPTGSRRRTRTLASSSALAEPASTFEEDDNDH